MDFDKFYIRIKNARHLVKLIDVETIEKQVNEMSRDELYKALNYHNDKVLENLENDGSDIDFAIHSCYCNRIEEKLADMIPVISTKELR